MSRSLKAHLLLVAATLIWGSTFVVVKASLQFASPLVFTTFRMGLAAMVLALVYRKHLAAITRPSLLGGFTVGLLVFLGYALQTTGLKLTTPSKSAFLAGTASILVPLALIVFWRARIHPWRAAGTVAAFAGLFLMTIPAGNEAFADFGRVNRGDLLTIASAIAFTFQIILVGRATQRFPFEQILVVQIAVAALLTAIATPLVERPHLQCSGTLITAILIAGILATVVAFGVQAWAQQFTPATHAALIFALEPVFAWLTSFIFLKERLGIRPGIGASLILTGVFVSELFGNVSQVESELSLGRNPANSAGSG